MDYEESDWGDDDFDDDYDDDDDYDYDDDDSETISCPACGAAIYEDSEACSACGEYLYLGYRAGYNRGWWTFGGALDEWSPTWVLLAVAGVIAVIFSLMMFF